jgi:hypothetical protein
LETLEDICKTKKILTDVIDEDLRQRKLGDILNQIDLAIIKIDALINRDEKALPHSEFNYVMCSSCGSQQSRFNQVCNRCGEALGD